MTFEMVSAYYFFGIIGGIYAIYAGSQKVWKKFTGNVEMLYARGGFYNAKVSGSAVISVGLVNHKDVSVALTDIIGTFKYDKTRWKRDKANPDRVFSIRPKIEPSLPLNIEPEEAIGLKLHFEMGRVQLHALERFGIAQFLGFENNVPVAVIDMSQNGKEWEQLPVLMTLSIHVNGKDVLSVEAPLDPVIGNTDDSPGSLSVVRIAEIEHKIGSVEND